MADEETTQEQPKVEAPQFDAAALGKQISDSVAQQVAETLKHQPTPQPHVAQPAEPEDALAAVIEPYIRAGTAKANLIAQMASDKADFYTHSDPDELEDRLAYKEEIEKRTLGMASMGRALPREDIYRHLKGEKFNEFVEKSTKRKQKREERARNEGQDYAGDGMPRVRHTGETYVDVSAAHDLQGKGKLDEFLNDKSF